MEVEMETGLMPQIQALIAPPASDAPPKVKRKEREDKRKGGKGQNRDTCDACGDCGSLICCEKCPTALHLQCQDPPLEEDDVPLGEWLCRVCRAKAAKKDKKCLDKVEEMDPLDILIKATEQANPYRYDISRRYKPAMPFPGAEKGPKKIATRRSSSTKKTQPEQTRICFGCNKGPRVGQMVNCDYCSLSYHLDCLDPPLTVPPLGTWMCPNHAEHFLDAYLLQTTSGVERDKIWNMVAKDIDHEALKLEFIRKVSRKNPPFRYKVKKPERPRATIPPAVQQMYEKPVPLVPSLPNNVKLERTWKVGEAPTETEVNDWLSSLFAMQASLAWEISTKKPEVPVSSPKNPEMVEEMMEQMFSSKNKLNRTAVDSFIAQLEMSSNATVEAQVAKMDPRLVKLLAAQRLQQVLPQFKQKNNLAPDTKVKIKEEPSQVLASFDENAFLKNGVIHMKKNYVALKDINGGLKVEEMKNQMRLHHDEELEEGEVTVAPAARAALAPIGSLLRITPVVMRFKTLTIGTSPDSDVCLNDFGQCQYTSPKHAKIFYDTMTGEYELLNYSPYGSIVDGCLYCLDATQWRVPSAPLVTDPLTQNVRSILDKRRGIKRDAEAAGTATVPQQTNRRVCGCLERISEPTGWEGSALLNHCSHLQFGCLQFVFSVMDFAPSKVITPEEEEKKKRKVEENGEVATEKDGDVEMKET